MKCNIPVQEEKELHVVLVTFYHVFDVQSAASEDPAKKGRQLNLDSLSPESVITEFISNVKHLTDICKRL